MSKNIKTTALVLVLLLAFLCGFGLGKNRGFNLNFNTNPTGTTAASDTKQADATTEPQSDPADKAADNTQKAAVKPAPTKAPKTEKEAVAAFNNAINSAKQAEHLTIGKTRTLDLTLGDTKPSLAKKAVTSALEKAIQPVDETYTVDAGSKQTAEELLSPAGRLANLKLSGVSSAKAKKTDTGYTVTIKLKEETASSTADKTVNAKMHNASLTLVNPAELKAFGLKAKDVRLQYSGAVIRLTIDKQGKLTGYQYTLPFTGEISGKHLFFPLQTAFEGKITENVVLSYS